MSIDYWSACRPCAAAEAAEILATLGGRQRCGAILGPDEETFAHAWRGVGEIDVDALAPRFAGSPPSRGYWEGASVQLPDERLHWVDDDAVFTNRTPALSGVDRILAIPHGVSLMRGQAVVHVPRKQLPALGRDLARLWSAARGRTQAAVMLQQYLRGNGNEGAAEAVIDLLDAALARAQSEKLDLVLLSATPA